MPLLWLYSFGPLEVDADASVCPQRLVHRTSASRFHAFLPPYMPYELWSRIFLNPVLNLFIYRLFLRFSCFRSFRNRRFIRRGGVRIDFHFKMRIRFFCGTIPPTSRRLIACSKKFHLPLYRSERSGNWILLTLTDIHFPLRDKYVPSSICKTPSLIIEARLFKHFFRYKILSRSVRFYNRRYSISGTFSKFARSCFVSLGRQYPPYPNEGLL